MGRVGTGRAGWLAAALLCLGAAPSGQRTVTGDGIVQGSVNGVSARIQIDPSAPATPLITAELAARAQLKPGPFAFEYLIGSQKVTGQTAIGRIDSGTGPDRRRIGWTERSVRAGVDGVIGPGMLNEPVVHFRLRPERPGERRVDFPLVDQGGLGGAWSARFALIQFGGRPMRLQFDPHAPDTLATAQAGAHLVRTLGGHWDSVPPRQAQIAFGIARPVRRLVLEQPFLPGPLAMETLHVRFHDFGSAGGIGDGPPDPDEIVVTAATKGNPRHDMVKLGADVLDRCSSITFDRRAKRISLHCL